MTTQREASPALVGERPAPSEEAGRVTLTAGDVRRIVREELAIVTANREAAAIRQPEPVLSPSQSRLLAVKRTSPVRRIFKR